MDILQLLDEHKKNIGNKIAHVYRESKITYNGLFKKSDSLAVYILEKYPNDKTPIVVYGHKQHEMLISFLACVNSGHAYIPIDSSLPQERIKDIIESSGTKLIINVSNEEFNYKDKSILDLEKLNNIFEDYKDLEPDKAFRVKEEDTYYIIYTSGSTGKPKGVQITLGCLNSFINWGLSLIDVPQNNDLVFMNQAPFSFDLSVMDLYLSLASGSTLFSIDKSMISNLKELFNYLAVSDISVWVSTPSFAEMCLADSKFGDNLLNKMKYFLFCGETLTNSCAERLMERFQNVKVINTYGPTEATVAITSIEVTKEICKNVSPLPVGYVKKDCKIFILDSKGNSLSEGEKGEIIIVGDSVSIGYYNNDVMTKKNFYNMNIDGQIKRCYRTGDEGYIKNGLLFYCGRIDFQVKLNGFRIELEDIENNFRNINYVKNSVVLPIEKEGKIQYLAAFVVLNEKTTEKEFKVVMDIKKSLKEYLPEYMIPRKVVLKENLPMTPNGKINRKLLLEGIK